MTTHTAAAKREWIGRDVAHVVHALHDRKLHEEHGHVWVKGEGAILTDADGKEYIDALSGLWNVVCGHGRKDIAEAAAAQMQTLEYCSCYSGSTSPPAIALGERLARMTYPRINRFVLPSGGSESTDASVKTARYYWRMKGKPDKTKVICRQWGYHGTTLAAMSATGIATYWPMFEPRVPGFVHIPSPYPYRYVIPPDAKPGTTQGVAAADELEKAILREGPETVAMFFAEPVQCSGGVIVPQDDYWPRIRAICDQYDVLLGVDEVITGFGRTGKMFGLEHWGVEPDLMQFAKAVTSGYFPLGGMGMSEEIARVLDTGEKTWMHAYTYSAHPVGCAVALKTLDIIEGENYPAMAAEKGTYLLKKLKEALAGHPHVGDVRGLGLVAAVEYVQDKQTKAEFPADQKVGHRVHLAAQERGLFTRLRGDCFCLAPPVITPYPLLDQIVERLRDATVAVLGPG